MDKVNVYWVNYEGIEQILQRNELSLRDSEL